MTIQSKFFTNFSYESVITPNILRVISYNITANFFDRNDTTPDQRHTWAFRAQYVKKALNKYNAHIMCLQELSVLQAIELYETFSNDYDCIFLNQTPSDIEITGKIVKNDELHQWENAANIGTPLIGIFVKRTAGLTIQESGRFWLNEQPDEIPTARDRAQTDKGFGNMNTYRAVLWAKIYNEISGKHLYVFNSHYPLSGDSYARLKCAETEMNKIRVIADNFPWVSCGDRNIIPLRDTEECNKNHVYSMLTSCGHDAIDPNVHYGVSNTWLGFTYDRETRNLDAENEILDVVVTNMQSICSAHDPVAFKDGELIPFESFNDEQIVNYINTERYLASDHCLVMADLEINA